MTDTQPEVAARLLREAADELRQSHTLPYHRSDWTGEPEAKAAYDEYMAAADAVDALHAAIERKDALLRQALGALEESADYVREDYRTNWRHGVPTRQAQLDSLKAQVDEHEAAIYAITKELQ